MKLKQKQLAALAVILVVVVGVVLIVHHHNSVRANQYATRPSSAKLLTGVKPITSNIVTINSSGFLSATLTVKKGSVVTWINADKSAHTVTETDGKDGPNSGSISAKRLFQFAYDKDGTYKYHSALQPKQTGTIVVVDQLPKASISKPVQGQYSNWHSYSLKYEKLSFSYPPSWQLKDASTAGHDNITLIGSKGFTAELQTGSSTPPSLPSGATILGNLDQVFAGHTVYLDFVSKPNAQLIGQVYVSTSISNASAAPAAKNAGGLIDIQAGYPASNAGESQDGVNKDQNYQNAKIIFDLLHY